MSSINQYIDLLNANREAIDSHSAGALYAARQSALEALAGPRMPGKGDDDYEGNHGTHHLGTHRGAYGVLHASGDAPPPCDNSPGAGPGGEP